MENAIRVERLSKRFGAVVARGPLDFDVGVGEVLGHLGPNGGQDHDDSAAAWHAASYPWQGPRSSAWMRHCGRAHRRRARRGRNQPVALAHLIAS